VGIVSDRTASGLEARRAALAALRRVEIDGAWSNQAVHEAVARLADARDRDLAAHLAYDTLRWQGTLDRLVATVVSRPLDDVEPALRRVLRLGALQLTRMRVEPHAALSTSVALAREQVPSARATGAAGFVNGVLRALQRSGAAIPAPDDAIDGLALTTGHPRWIVEELAARYGVARARTILDADNAPPGVTLRATGDRDALIDELAAGGIDARPGRCEAVRAPGADPRRLPAVAEGRAVVQDEASMLVVAACGVLPGARVLDVCAGPGGKTTLLAQHAGPTGRVVAVERQPHRAALVRDAAARVGVEVDVRTADATRFTDGTYDVVLADAPCTGLGTGRRRPEIRWRRTVEDLEALSTLQRRLLAAAVERVAAGGRLVYSVCTWTRAETTEVARWFDESYGKSFEPLERRQLLPDVDDTDGMFWSVWRRDHRE
jgi:16S rRNA (cytosine967-C5)-methyltransferase